MLPGVRVAAGSEAVKVDPRVDVGPTDITMFSLPHSVASTTSPALLDLHQSPEYFGRIIRDQLDVLYEDGATT